MKISVTYGRINMENTEFVSIWRATREAKSRVGYHSHHCYELVYYEKGQGTTSVGGKSYSYFDGSFMIIPPDVLHDEYRDTETDVICLGCTGVSCWTQQRLADPDNTVCRILKELLREVKNQDYGYQQMIRVKLQELQLHILRSEHLSGSEKNFEYMVNYLKENFHEKIVLSDCARQMNISYDYFQHAFKKRTGMSPQQLLLRQRLQAAKKLLASGNMSCTEIAYRCGFSTSAQFSALFKREYQRSPLQYRKHTQQNP